MPTAHLESLHPLQRAAQPMIARADSPRDRTTWHGSSADVWKRSRLECWELMGDLYFDDIENRSYSDKAILEDVRALVKTGQREGPLLDYKSDVSHKDNWPSTVAAFANTFGGLIVFGVEGKNDQPRRLTGFDPKGVEVKTKLTSMVIDRIQPRPNFSVRVVTHDQDPTREVALLRVAEGQDPPYMHSNQSEHRIYIRVGAQKTEADYLQLSSLLESERQRSCRRLLRRMISFDPILNSIFRGRWDLIS